MLGSRSSLRCNTILNILIFHQFFIADLYFKPFLILNERTDRNAEDGFDELEEEHWDMELLIRRRVTWRVFFLPWKLLFRNPWKLLFRKLPLFSSPNLLLTRISFPRNLFTSLSSLSKEFSVSSSTVSSKNSALIRWKSKKSAGSTEQNRFVLDEWGWESFVEVSALELFVARVSLSLDDRRSVNKLIIIHLLLCLL